MRPCPNCAIEPEPGDAYCGHCGTRLAPETTPDPSRRVPATLQGVAENWTCNGSFDSAEYEGLGYEDALGVLSAMQRPPADADPGAYCWPNLVFEDGTGVSRTPEGEDGDFFLYPAERFVTLPEAEDVVRELYLRGD